MSKHTFHVVRTSLDRGDFVCGDDGYYVYWPKGYTGGAVAAHELRTLADHLDRMNAAWDWIIQNDPLISGGES